MRRRLRRADPWLAASALALLILGVIVVISTTLDTPREPLLIRHVTSAVGAAALIVGLALISFRFFDSVAYVLYAVAIGGLLAVLVMGSVGYGAKRWLIFGPVRFQPAEFAKIATLLAVARYLSGARVDPTRLGTLLRAGALGGVPMLLILLQPDLGTALSFVGILVATLVWAGVPMLWFVFVVGLVASILASFRLPPIFGPPGGVLAGGTLTGAATLGLALAAWCVLAGTTLVALRRSGARFLTWATAAVVLVVGGVSAPYAWHGLEDYQRERVLSFLDPGRDPSGSGYQVIQSEIAIGSGGVRGKGFRHGSQKGLAYLPEHHTDFVFSVVGEEFGFVGSSAILGLFVLLLLRGVRIARLARDRFASLLVIGAVGLLAYHVFVNLYMTMGLAPVTGLPLPFLSYGGSFLIVCGALVGLMQGVAMRRRY